MSHLADWIHTPFARALGWTLVHFVWEGAVLALLLAGALWLLRPATSTLRHGLACLALAAMPLTFAVTLRVMLPSQPVVVRTIVATRVAVAPVAVAVSAPASRWTPARLLDRLAWLVPLWIAGVLFFYVRGAAGWVALRRWRRRGVCAPRSEWQARLNELATRLRVSRQVTLLESCLTDTPVLIGYLRPVILLPLGCLAGMSASQVECILLHELAHVQRHDFVVNLLQSMVEGLLFYHPAVWWVSSAVSATREECCDDAVVSVTEDAYAYAATLAVLEQSRTPQAALAATGGSLIRRIRRLTTPPSTQSGVAPAVSAGSLLVVLAVALNAWPAKPPVHRTPPTVAMMPQPRPQAPARSALAEPYRKWLEEDVAYIIKNEERTAFRGMQTDKERETFIENFWIERDPTPGTTKNEFKEEHYRRIAYANEHFGAGIPGWKTDRGRIYIRYGPPDAIRDSKTEAVWHYKFIEGTGTDIDVGFVDPQGNGEFRLRTDLPRAEAVAPPQPVGFAKVFVATGEPSFTVMVPGRGEGGGADRQLAGLQAADAELEKQLANVQQRLQTEESQLLVARMALSESQRDSEREFVVLATQYENAKKSYEALTQKYQADFPAVLEAKRKVAETQAAIAEAPGRAEEARHGMRGEELVQTSATAIAQDRQRVNQLEIEIDRNRVELAKVRAVSGRGEPGGASGQLVTMQMALKDPARRYRVFLDLATGGKIVQSAEGDTTGQPAWVRAFPLAAGRYQATVQVKDLTSGSLRTSAVDFTVE